MAFKPRILITVATASSCSEVSIIKGRPMRDGKPSPGPTAEQIAIVQRAIVELMAHSAKETK